jgi:hypothetical protein
MERLATDKHAGIFAHLQVTTEMQCCQHVILTSEAITLRVMVCSKADEREQKLT